ncbi:FAD binding domain-containing protein [Actinomadura luteofluorescens]|uniref:FAD binding domain-containing protein n=1 Tax=Actinomadura luteofluorescens TaxID=46163 RepID=UPI00363DF59C
MGDAPRPAGPVPGPGAAVPDIAEIVRPESLAEAGAALRGGTAIGGGTDVLLQRRQRLAAPERLVSTALLPGLRDITEEPDGTAVIGAAVTLAELSARFAESIPALAEVADSIASPQVRNAATVAGNLLQAKRCWFFRNDFPCYKRNGASSPCYAILGDHRFYHAAVDGHRCQAVTPSDLATVLAALDAVVELSDGRRIPIGDLYTGPGETALKQTDLVVAVRIPEPGRPCVFEKLALWQGDFAVVSVAASSRSAERWDDCRIVFGALAPTPWRPADAERALDGRPFDPAALRDVVDAELTRHGHPCPATPGSSTPPPDSPNAPPNDSPMTGRKPYDGAGPRASGTAAGRREAHRPRAPRRTHHRHDRHPQPHRRGGRTGPLGGLHPRRLRDRRRLPADRRCPGQRRRPAPRRRNGPRPSPLRPDRHADDGESRRGPAPGRRDAALRHGPGTGPGRRLRHRPRREQPEGPRGVPRRRAGDPAPGGTPLRGDVVLGLGAGGMPTNKRTAPTSAGTTRARATAPRSCWNRASGPTSR